jgi:hypothetical protein
VTKNSLIKMLPIRIDPDGTPIFSDIDVDDYGLPSSWGYTRYYVVEEARYQYTYEQEKMVKCGSILLPTKICAANF